MEASTSDYRPKCGRPKLEVPVQRIGLRMDVYDEWLAKKDSVGFSEKTHSEFAAENKVKIHQHLAVSFILLKTVCLSSLTIDLPSLLGFSDHSTPADQLERTPRFVDASPIELIQDVLSRDV